MSRVVAVAAPAARKWAATRKRAVLALAALLIAISAVPFAGAGWIHAKAILAQMLLEHSWQARLNGAEEGAAKPWPWAGTTPVARLQVPRLEVDQMVLAGASGRSLAFGPGHLTGTALPGERGNSVITGHRDTHFNFIGELRTGDTFRVQRPDGGTGLLWVVQRFANSAVPFLFGDLDGERHLSEPLPHGVIRRRQTRPVVAGDPQHELRDEGDRTRVEVAGGDRIGTGDRFEQRRVELKRPARLVN